MTRKQKKELLKTMHKVMLHVNDEDCYFHWIITGVPDEPTDDDFEYIASDNELFNDTVSLFTELVDSFVESDTLI